MNKKNNASTYQFEGSSILIRPSIPEDGTEISKNIRLPDRNEIKHRYGLKPELALPLMILSRRNKLSFTIEWNGMPHGIFGVSSASQNVGCPWFLSSAELIASFKKTFVGESKQWLKVLYQDYDLLENYILEENSVHIRWIQSLGFTLEERHEKFGVGKATFWKFRKILNATKLY